VGPALNEMSFAEVVEDCKIKGKSFPLVSAPAPCVYRSRAVSALENAAVSWSTSFSSPSLAGAIAAVRAGLGYLVLPVTMATPDLIIRDDSKGWPSLPEAEICLLVRENAPAQAKALAAFIASNLTTR
jgi:DNA-binding transcriptional LysR family regulator